MMVCPGCRNYSASRVMDSRAIDHGNCIRRRRVCEACTHRWTTYERNDDRPRAELYVVNDVRVAEKETASCASSKSS